ncbi:hypothetical protein [Methanobrevibacter curvatus]|uniref:Uncharacterized protein n=1 Tax=Methanobrevibacter curvatus TaxID=49547 RepID=A0A166BDF5_9EURY|nr:hypothetical protein [Methanobrevibacter curvatus]KZX13184.1 hypothetical protein MBCUR_07110 [Methanobrevibacter curvatus]
MEDIIEKGIKNNESKIPEHLIANKNTYSSNSKRFLESTTIIKGGDPFNAVKFVRQVRSGDYDIP